MLFHLLDFDRDKNYQPRIADWCHNKINLSRDLLPVIDVNANQSDRIGLCLVSGIFTLK